MSAAWYPDDFHEWPEVQAAIASDLSSIGLYARASAWVARHETDGYIPASVALHLVGHLAGADVATVQALVDSGLWEPRGDHGWTFRRWSTHRGPNWAAAAAGDPA